MEPDARLRDGRYVVRGLLGEGGQGTTYDAVDVREGRTVAIKRFDVRGARSLKDMELAEREARVLATLDHPLVPRYVDHFEENGALHLVMEKVEGETLEAMRRRLGALPEDEVRRFLAYADRALTYLHGRTSPVVHRDVKPRNVVRRSDGSYVFVDFGAVSELMLRRGGSTIVGTMGYMAPEQLQGRALPATDVYAVGATALAALTGAEPETLPHQGLRIDVRSALQGRASPALIASLERMLEPDPDRRAPSVAAALEGLTSAPPSPHASPALPFAPTPGPSGQLETANEDALVKSIRKLLWVLWGLGWVIVPSVLKHFHATGLVPAVMFVSLAVLIIVGWHKGALLRAAIRSVANKKRTNAVRSIEAAPRQRIEIGVDRHVRVHTSDVEPEELVGETELQSAHSGDAHRRARHG